MPEGEDEEQEIENLFGKKKEKTSLIWRRKYIQVQEAQRVLKKMDPKRITQRHIIIKMPKVKDGERILKASRENQKVTYRAVPIKLLADFLRAIAG